MTKPTEEQIKALKPGDKVLVECVVTENIASIIAQADERGGRVTFVVNNDHIHSILPREIKVGDKVRYVGWDDEPWEVVAGPRPSRQWAVEYAIWRESDGFERASADCLGVVS